MKALQPLDVIIVFVHYTIFTTAAKKNPNLKNKKLERERNVFNIYPAPRNPCTIEVWFTEEGSDGKILKLQLLSLKAQT